MLSIKSHQKTEPADNPVLFIHGFMQTNNCWQTVLSALDLDHQSIYMGALPGHGLKARIDTNISFSDIVQYTLDKWPFQQKCKVVAYSMGARFALNLVLKCPERFSKALLIGVNPGIDNKKDKQQRRLWDEKMARQLLTGSLCSFVNQWEKLAIFASQSKLDAKTLATQRADRLSHNPKQLAFAMRNLGLGNMDNLWERLKVNTVPIWCVAGSLDPKFIQIGLAMAQINPAVSCISIPDSGHNPLLEQPIKLAQIISDFCAEFGTLRSIQRDQPR